MTLTPDEARGALTDIDQVARRMRNTVAASSLGPSLTVWGLVWMLGFGLTHWFHEHVWIIWGTLIALGGMATTLTTIRLVRRRDIESATDRKQARQLAWFWVTVIGYASLLAFLLHPSDYRDFPMIFVLMGMMGYILMGIWLRSGPLAFTGVLVTIAAVIGRVYEPFPYMLWMAIFGGGGLFFPGLYVWLRWR